MPDDEWRLFATDPRGYRVFCSDCRMEEIYNHHPELRNFWASEKDIEHAISHAMAIFQSTHGNNFHVFYRSKERKNVELKVVVRFKEDNVGELYAAQPSVVGQRKRGEVMIWPISTIK
jgi:hypothetical protein